MASYHDLLDAIARVRSATGDPDSWKKGLTGDDLATAFNPASPPPAIGAVLTKLAAAHPDVFLVDSSAAPSGPPPRVGEGAAADAIRHAEAALARQNTDAAHVDLQVVTAVLNAHVTHADGMAELTALQHDIEDAVVTRTDLDTQAGAREFLRYLIGKLREIRDIVENASLDATSKASLAAALATLYASSTPDPQDHAPVATPPKESGSPPETSTAHQTLNDGISSSPAFSAHPPTPADEYSPDLLSSLDPVDPLAYGMPVTDPPVPPPHVAPVQPPANPALPPPVAAQPPPMPMPPVPAPVWGGGSPSGAPLGAALPALSPGSASLPAPPPLADPRSVDLPRNGDNSPPDVTSDPTTATDPPADDTGAPPGVDDATTVDLPDGDTVIAPSPELAAAITAAVGGTPIPDAFRQQGIVLPEPGTAVVAPLDGGRLTPGDIGILADRHALALGNGKALLDKQIQPITSVMGPGFIGWQHPPEPESSTATPEIPAPNRAAATAPS